MLECQKGLKEIRQLFSRTMKLSPNAMISNYGKYLKKVLYAYCKGALV